MAADTAREEGQARIASLLMKHRTQLQAYLLAAVHHLHDSEDLLQDVCFAASRSWEKYVPGTNFLAWALTIARHRVLQHAQKRRKLGVPLDPALLDSLEEAARWHEENDPIDRRRKALAECLDRLQQLPRRVLNLRYVGATGVGRIARAIGRTAQGTYALLKRTRLLLRDCAERRLSEVLPESDGS